MLCLLEGSVSGSLKLWKQIHKFKKNKHQKCKNKAFLNCNVFINSRSESIRKLEGKKLQQVGRFQAVLVFFIKSEQNK